MLHEADGTTPLQATGLEDCRQKASDKGMVGFVYRNAKHEMDEWKNVCSGYENATNASGDLVSVDDDIHFSGCVDPTKTWGSC